MDHGPGLLIGFGNQLRVLLEGVGTVAARSAARGPRFYDGLAETSDRGFIWVWRDFSVNFVLRIVAFAISAEIHATDSTKS